MTGRGNEAVLYQPARIMSEMIDELNGLSAIELQHAIDHAKEQGVKMPVLKIKNESYSVTFEDPTKAEGAVFKRFECYEGDTFTLKGVRKTRKNLIFRFDLGENVARNMARRKTGPGLSTEWSTAGFTLSLLKNKDRLNSPRFLNEVLDLYAAFHESERQLADVERTEEWGSW